MALDYAPAGTEIHSCQPIGLNKVLLVENGLPPKLMIVDKKTGRMEVGTCAPRREPHRPEDSASTVSAHSNDGQRDVPRALPKAE